MAYGPELLGADGLESISTRRLYHAARGVTGALSASEVATSAFQHAVGELDASSVGLWLLEARQVRLVASMTAGGGPATPITLVPTDADLPVAECARTGQIVYYGSRAERDHRWPSLPAVETGPEAMVVLPLVAAGRALGCLHIGYPKPMEPVGLDLDHLSMLAELCAVALQRARQFDAERERQSFLLDAWTAVADAGGYADTLRRLAAIAVPRVADLCLIDVKDASQRVRRMAAVHADPSKAALAAELAERYAPLAGGPHPASSAMTTGRSTWSPVMTDDFLRATTRDEHHFELVKQLNFTSYMSVPLVAGSEVLGAITLVSAGSGRTFDGSDLALAEELASRVASVVVTARRRDQEHQLAHELQRLLLPEHLASTPGLEVAVRYLTAATEAEAGGDFYDVVSLPSGGLGLMVGDVEGHDTTAAATMGQLRSASRALSGQVDGPGALVDALRWSWDLLGFSRTATAIFSRIDPATGEMLLASAGHLPPIVVSPDGLASFVPVETSPPFGVAAGAAEDHWLVLDVGSTLFFYTDGLVERRRSTLAEELCQLRASLDGSADIPLEQLCDRILVAYHAASLGQDDVAVLAVRRVACTGALGPTAALAYPNGRPGPTAALAGPSSGPSQVGPPVVESLEQKRLNRWRALSTRRAQRPVLPVPVRGGPASVGSRYSGRTVITFAEPNLTAGLGGYLPPRW